MKRYFHSTVPGTWDSEGGRGQKNDSPSSLVTSYVTAPVTGKQTKLVENSLFKLVLPFAESGLSKLPVLLKELKEPLFSGPAREARS